MIISLILLVPVLTIALWAFFRFRPHGNPKRALFLYNSSIIMVAIVFSLFLTYEIYGKLAGTSDHAWWPILALTGSSVIIILCLAVGGVLRNFVIFRNSIRQK